MKKRVGREGGTRPEYAWDRDDRCLFPFLS